ncbi:hypothetical protein SDC9_142511 [bioreactor metagenome]|uniref:Uncharacterized protein n=1 Tax=bioreactor metagenome TaxID=1076179 RepID=A0A645E110_9ZZZZ
MSCEHPHLGALAHQHVAETQRKLALGRVLVVHELRIEQVHRQRDAPRLHREAAVEAGPFDVLLYVTRIRRADIYDRSERTGRLFLIGLHRPECLIGCRVRISGSVQILLIHGILLHSDCRVFPYRTFHTPHRI